jgi:oligopeptide transport system substrate-binding protein
MGSWYSYIVLAWLCCSCESSSQQASLSLERLRLSFYQDPFTTDPRKNSDPVSCALISMIYEGITHLEPDGSVSLGLAQSIDISKNYTRYTIHLRDAYWSNGAPITAYDIAYSWKKILMPQFNSINAYFLYPILNAKSAKLGAVSTDDVGIYIEDEKTLTLRLESPNTYFLEMLAFTTYFPISQEFDRDQIEPLSQVFSGPFVLAEWQHNNYLLLKKNPLFWNADAVKLDQIHISIVPDEHTALQLHQAGELDWLGGFFSPLPIQELASFQESPEYYHTEYAGTSLCFFNTHCFPFTNINIRKAFSYSIEKASIVEHLCQGHEQQAYGIVPPLLKHFKQTKFIPTGSKELARHHFELGLKELNLSRNEFPELIFSIPSLSLQKTIGLALQQQWRETLGVSIALEPLEFKIFLDKLYHRNYQFALMSILAQYFDPMNFLERFLVHAETKNFCSWENTEYQRLVGISSDLVAFDERLSVLEKAESILMSEAPVAPIYYHALTYLQHKRVEGIQISPIGIADFRYAYFSETKKTQHKLGSLKM